MKVKVAPSYLANQFSDTICTSTSPTLPYKGAYVATCCTCRQDHIQHQQVIWVFNSFSVSFEKFMQILVQPAASGIPPNFWLQLLGSQDPPTIPLLLRTGVTMHGGVWLWGAASHGQAWQIWGAWTLIQPTVTLTSCSESVFIALEWELLLCILMQN